MGYTSQGADRHLLEALFHGQYALQFWGMAIVGLFIPAVLLALPWTRTVGGILTAAVMINVGMWLKRSSSWCRRWRRLLCPSRRSVAPCSDYVPTWVEWSITAGAFSGFCLLYILFSKLFPIVSIWEVEAAAAPQSRPEAAPQPLGQEALPWPAR